MKSALTQEMLRSLVHYEPESGVFTWLHRPEVSVHVKRWNARNAGKVAGHSTTGGYQQLTIFGRHYKSHRLAWLYVYGAIPNADIDHINGITSDNRIINLREATRSQNLYNEISPRRHNKSGLRGVKWCSKNSNYQARIRVDKKEVHLGTFATAQEAHAIYVAAQIKHGKEFSGYLSRVA